MRAFTLTEVMLSLLLVAVAVLALLGLCAVVLKSTRKAGDLPSGALVADQILTETVTVYQNDAGLAGTFWSTDYVSQPLAQGARTVGRVDFSYVIYAETVRDTLARPLGQGLVNNNLKRVEAVVTWMGGGNGRPGYGRLSVTRTRLVHE